MRRKPPRRMPRLHRRHLPQCPPHNLPLLRHSLQVALILRTILAFQVFAVVIVMSGGDIITVLANETYRQYYDLRNFNVAAAYASFILLLSMITAFFYLRAVRTQEEVAE